MAGILGILGLAMITGSGFANEVRKDLGTRNARNTAMYKGDIYYIDGHRRFRSTETDEFVVVNGFPGSRKGFEVIGIKSGRVYAYEESKKNLDKVRFEEAIQYCKDNNLKYLPWYYPNNIISKDRTACTGIEVETGRKYICVPGYKQNHLVIYLEDEPHKRYTNYGYVMEYDAIHDGSEELRNENSELCKHEKHNGAGTDYDYWYYTKAYRISEEDYNARITELKQYPYDLSKVRPDF